MSLPLQFFSFATLCCMNEPSSLEVKSEGAATLLNTKTRQLLAPFVGKTKSVKAASDELSVKLTTYYPYVKQFERAGLIGVVEVTPRSGRAVKHYRSVADGYFVPHTVSPLMVYYEELELKMHQTMWQALLKAWLTGTAELSTWGLRCYKYPDVGLGVMGAESQNEPGHLFSGKSPIIFPRWRTLELNQEQVRAVQLELRSILEKYTAAQAGSDAYLVRVATVPLPEEST